MLMELRSAFDELDEDAAAKVVVLRGAGRAFSAGADLRWERATAPEEWVEMYRLGKKTFAKIETMGTPVIAAVHGYAPGGGLELALAADFIVCSDDALLGLPEIALSAEGAYRPAISKRLDATEGRSERPRQVRGGGPGVRRAEAAARASGEGRREGTAARW